MASRFEKVLWSILCGSALGLGATGCYESDQDMYGPPPDVSTDADADVDASDVLPDPETDTAPDFDTLYGPAPMYGPEP